MAVMPNGDVIMPRKGHQYPSNPNENIYVRDALDSYHFRLKKKQEEKLNAKNDDELISRLES